MLHEQPAAVPLPPALPQKGACGVNMQCACGVWCLGGAHEHEADVQPSSKQLPRAVTGDVSPIALCTRLVPMLC